MVAGVSCLLMLLVGATTFSLVHHELERQLDRRIELEVQSLLAAHQAAGFDMLVRAVNSRDSRPAVGSVGYVAGLAETQSRMGYILIDADGRRRAGAFDAPMPPPGWSEFVRFRRPDGSRGVAQAMNLELPGGGRLVVAADRGALIALDRKLLRLFLIEIGLVIAVAAAAAFCFGRIVERRLKTISDAAEEIMAGDLSRRMPLDGSGGEFDHLAAALNRMLARIEDLVGNLRQVSGDIAHDLRTPLMRLRGRLEEAERKASSPEQQQLLDGGLREVDDLQALLSGLLALSEIEGQSLRDRFAPVDLQAAVAELAEAYGPAFESAGLSLSLDLRPAVVRGDRPLLLQALSNLLDNSLAHAGAGAHVRIALRSIEDRVKIDFSDDGPGVAPEARARIFRRFVRLDPARSAPGHGLGLATVSAIISAHGGTIVVAPTAVGLAFQIELPAAQLG